MFDTIWLFAVLTALQETQPRVMNFDPTWPFVVLTALQGTQLCVMTWLGIREKQCQQKLREMKHELRNLRQQISNEGEANRTTINHLASAVGDHDTAGDQGKLSDPDA